MVKRIFVLVVIVVLGTAGLAKLSRAQMNQNGPQQSRNGDDAEIHVLPVQGNVYMLVGAGGNITVQAGKEGILLVDTGLAPMSDKVFAAIRTISAEKEEGGTYVIPGHGRLCDQADVIYYQEMVIIIRDRIQDMVKKGMTLEQVKAAHPTRDYDPRYGTNTGAWTTDMFVEAVYRSLSKKH